MLVVLKLSNIVISNKKSIFDEEINVSCHFDCNICYGSKRQGKNLLLGQRRFNNLGIKRQYGS